MTDPWWMRPRDTWTARERARYAWLVVCEHVEKRILAPIQCAISGHLWDSDRPRGPIHAQDICWRCSRIRPGSTP